MFYHENFCKLIVSALSLVALLLFNSIDSILVIGGIIKTESVEEVAIRTLIQCIAQALGLLAYLAGKIYEDLFVELNRDKT